jgi:hypothetical protein
MKRPLLLFLASCTALTLTNAAHPQERPQLLSTAEWAALSNTNQQAGLLYLKGVLDTLGAIGNFTCKTPVVLAQTAVRIRLDLHDNPEKIQTWFVPALMADLTRNHHCRFLDTDRLKYSNEKLAEWEATR